MIKILLTTSIMDAFQLISFNPVLKDLNHQFSFDAEYLYVSESYFSDKTKLDSFIQEGLAFRI